MSDIKRLARHVLKDRDKGAIAARGQVNGHADNATDRLYSEAKYDDGTTVWGVR